jgi:AraC-like DNA-binding protein
VIRYREIQPSARLEPILYSFWILEHDGESAAPQRIVPDGHSELILNWERPFEALDDGQWRGQPQCFLAGQIEGPLLLRPRGPARMLGIGFHPHGAARVFAPPMHELSGQFTPVEDLSQALAHDLRRALEMPDTLAAVESALLSAAERIRRADTLIQEAVRRVAVAKGATDLARLARDLGLSTRQFERRFHAAVGLPPKLFCRIERFNRVFRALGQGPGSWVDRAIDCGYYDQAHLIRDCRSFSGTTPAVLLADDADLARYFYRRFGMSHSSNTPRRAAV